MNKEELIKLGVAEDVADKVVEAHRDSIDGNYVTKSRFNEVNEENKTLTQQVKDRDTQLVDLGDKVKDNEELTTEIERLKEENESKSTEYQKELDKLKVKHSAERQILDYKARDLTSVLAHVDLSEAGLNDDGTVQGLKDKLDALKEEKAFLFEEEETKEPEKPKFKGAQPGNPKGDEPGGAPDPSKMTYSEYVEYLESQN